jgi:2-polyprenyl-3-methyl-5-hydroxy-6-metoxy-1,4-benzoquinol methylase
MDHHSRYDWPFASWTIDESEFPRKYRDFMRVVDRCSGGREKLRGKHALDCGCGFGAVSVALARRGAAVEAFDISPHMVEVATRLVRENGVAESVTIRQGMMEKLDYPSSTFDLVVGTTVLHHVDIEPAAGEISRVLKPGGLAVFWEPIARSRLRERLRLLYRHHFPRLIPGTAWEHPLTAEEIEILESQLGGSMLQPLFFSPFTVLASKVLGARLRRVKRPLERADSILDRVCPFLGRFENDHIMVFGHTIDDLAVDGSSLSLAGRSTPAR